MIYMGWLLWIVGFTWISVWNSINLSYMSSLYKFNSTSSLLVCACQYVSNPLQPHRWDSMYGWVWLSYIWVFHVWFGLAWLYLGSKNLCFSVLSFQTSSFSWVGFHVWFSLAWLYLGSKNLCFLVPSFQTLSLVTFKKFDLYCVRMG